MIWKIEISERAAKKIKKLDPVTRKRIQAKLMFIANLDYPQGQAKPLSGNLVGLWRIRVGDYRVICTFEEKNIIIFLIDIGHRNDIYNAY